MFRYERQHDFTPPQYQTPGAITPSVRLAFNPPPLHPFHSFQPTVSPTGTKRQTFPVWDGVFCQRRRRVGRLYSTLSPRRSKTYRSRLNIVLFSKVLVGLPERPTLRSLAAHFRKVSPGSLSVRATAATDTGPQEREDQTLMNPPRDAGAGSNFRPPDHSECSQVH